MYAMDSAIDGRGQARAEHRRGEHRQQDAGEREQDVQAGGDHRVDRAPPPGRDDREQRRPRAIASTTTASGPSIEDCAPASSRDSTSRPSKSKPSRCPPTGPTQASARFGSDRVVRGEQRAEDRERRGDRDHGRRGHAGDPGRRAGRTATGRLLRRDRRWLRRAALTTGLWPRSLVPCAPQRDPRVEHRVQQVDEHVDHARTRRPAPARCPARPRGPWTRAACTR